MRRIEVLLFALALIGCAGGKGDGVDTGDGDADTEVDPDTDADTDTDTDTGTGGPKDTLAGSLTWFTALDGDALCDAVIEITGEEYRGPCPGCTFAFDVEGTVGSTGGADCDLPEPWTFVPDTDPVTDYGWLAYAPSYTQKYTGVTYDKTLLVGIGQDFSAYGGQSYPPVFFPLYASNYPPDPNITTAMGLSYGSQTLDFAFTQAFDFGVYDYLYYATSGPVAFVATSALLNVDPGTCTYDEAEAMEPNPLVVGTQSVQDDVDCSTLTADVVAFELVAGDVVSFSVDTPNPKASFDPIAWVNGPDTCTLSTWDENVACTNPPIEGWSCPAGTFTAAADGPHQIVIASWGFFATYSGCDPGVAAGAYDLQVDAPLAPPLTLVDDAAFWDLSQHFDRDYSLSAVITPAAP